ncbi:MAG: hypothetical protein MZV64_48615 [Ignavibacteriales bacterium]|nr:hypothetical protein [Ignavibacteriales bacterium]
MMSIVDDLSEDRARRGGAAATPRRGSASSPGTSTSSVFIVTGDFASVLYVNPRYTSMIGGLGRRTAGRPAQRAAPRELRGPAGGHADAAAACRALHAEARAVGSHRADRPSRSKRRADRQRAGSTRCAWRTAASGCSGSPTT